MWYLGLGGGIALRGGLSKGSKAGFTRVSETTTENYKWLGQQARLKIEPGTSCLPVRVQNHSAIGGAVSGFIQKILQKYTKI